MNEVNFLKRVSSLKTGDGFVREKVIPLSSVVADGASAAALSSGVISIQLDANNESLTTPFQVPSDYDESKDGLSIVVTAELTTGDGSTNAITLNLDDVYLIRPGAAAPEDISSSVTSDAQGVAATVEQYVFDLSGLGLKVGDVLHIGIDAQRDGSGVAKVYGVSLRYNSDLASFNEDERSSVTFQVTND